MLIGLKIGNLQQLRLFRIRTWFPFHWECAKIFRPNVGTCLWHVSTAIANVSSRWKHGQRHVATLWRYRFWWFDTSPTPNWWYKVTYFFPHHPKKVYESTSLRVYGLSKFRKFEAIVFTSSSYRRLGGWGRKKSRLGAWRLPSGCLFGLK